MEEEFLDFIDALIEEEIHESLNDSEFDDSEFDDFEIIKDEGGE